MHIDWFVLLAQLVNFLILIYLLKRFLYTRIIQAMNEREAKIAARFDEAERLKREAEEAARVYEEKNSFLQGQEEKMLNQAREVVNHRQKEWMDSAREEVDAIRRRWIETVLQEKAAFLEHLRQRTGKQVFAIARKILDDLADTAIESKMVDVLIDRIHSLDPAEREKICSALEDSEEGAIVQSAFALFPEDRQRLTDTVRDLLGKPDAVIRYQESSDLIGGIEFLASGHRIAWSISDYLEHLKQDFDRVLHEEVRQTLPKPSGESVMPSEEQRP